MANSDTEVVIIGGGAAGIAAAKRLTQAAIDCLLVEARPRLGGRAWTVIDNAGNALDLGCGWLHSADRNPWVQVAAACGFTIDKSLPPWERPPLPYGFPPDQQDEFRKSLREFFAKVGQIAAQGGDVAAAAALPGTRWDRLLGAVTTYISGAEPSLVSARDFDNYDDTGINWRVREGYGATIAAHGEGLATVLDCPVRQIDHRGTRLKIETAKGTITADRAIVTLPTAIIAENEFLFAPALPDKIEAARGLPLGLADKLFMSLDNAEEFTAGGQLFGNIDRVATAAYYFRPFGRPMIEAYFCGALARELEAGGQAALFDFAKAELGARMGHDFTKRLKATHSHSWGADLFALGSYSYAVPGKADCRAKLAAPVNDRLFFAGEACSLDQFSTAHGGWLTGIAAADAAIAARQRQRPV
ncbi:MAG: NAD(P)/FAD-dependent oxidoreductase [Pseudolabrys sp.]